MNQRRQRVCLAVDGGWGWPPGGGESWAQRGSCAWRQSLTLHTARDLMGTVAMSPPVSTAGDRALPSPLP